MNKKHKKEIEKLDLTLSNERKNELKKIKQTQVCLCSLCVHWCCCHLPPAWNDVLCRYCQMKDLKNFQSELKLEEKQLEKSIREEMQSVSKVERKDILRRKLSEHQGFKVEKVGVVLSLLLSLVTRSLSLQESSYKSRLGEDLAQLESALAQKHKDEKRSIELKCMLARHDLIRR